MRGVSAGMSPFPIQMGKCPVIQGDGVMLIVTTHLDPSVGWRLGYEPRDAATSPSEWGGKTLIPPVVAESDIIGCNRV